MARAEWFSLFEASFATRFRAEFPDAGWIFLVNDPAARVTARPRGKKATRVAIAMPSGFLQIEPYVAAAQVAAQVRMKAEDLGLVSRSRTLEAKLPSSGEFRHA